MKIQADFQNLGALWKLRRISKIEALSKNLGGCKGREHNPPPCSRHLGQVVKGCVTLWRQSCLTPPPSPSLLASWEIADRHPNQTILPNTRLLPCTDRNCRPAWHRFQPQGVRSTLYTVYNTLYKHLAGSFWVLRQNLQQVVPNQEKPHTTPLHSLIYSIYISVGGCLKFRHQSCAEL